MSPNELWFSIDFVFTLFFEEALFLNEGAGLVCRGSFAASFAHGSLLDDGGESREEMRAFGVCCLLIVKNSCLLRALHYFALRVLRLFAAVLALAHRSSLTRKLPILLFPRIFRNIVK